MGIVKYCRFRKTYRICINLDQSAVRFSIFHVDVRGRAGTTLEDQSVKYSAPRLKIHLPTNFLSVKMVKIIFCETVNVVVTANKDPYYYYHFGGLSNFWGSLYLRAFRNCTIHRTANM